MLFNFLWNSGPDRISRKNIVKDLDNGGLRMIHINNFIKALKITWIRRLIVSSHSNLWSSLSNIDFIKLLTVGDGFSVLNIQRLKNPFWIDLLQSWKEFTRHLNIENISEILHSPIWYNSLLNCGQNVCIKNWYDKGVRSISDFINADGQFYNFEEFRQTYNIRGTFLDYSFILNKIPNAWTTLINRNPNICKDLKMNAFCLETVKILLKDKKGSRRIYDMMLPNEPNNQNRWTRELDHITIDEWSMYNSSLK